MKRLAASVVLVLSAGLLVGLWFLDKPRETTVAELLASAEAFRAEGDVRAAHEVYRRALGLAQGGEQVPVLAAMMANMGEVEMRSVAQAASRLAYVAQTADAIVAADPDNLEAMRFRLAYAKTLAEATGSRSGDELLLQRSEELLELAPEDAAARQAAALARWRLAGGDFLTQRTNLLTAPVSGELAAALAGIDLQEAAVVGATAPAVQDVLMKQALSRFQGVEGGWRERLVRWRVARLRGDANAEQEALAQLAGALEREDDEEGWLACWRVLVDSGAGTEAMLGTAPTAQTAAFGRGVWLAAKRDAGGAIAAYEEAAILGPRRATLAAVAVHRRQLAALLEARQLRMSLAESGDAGEGMLAKIAALEARYLDEGGTLSVAERVRSAFLRGHYHAVLHLVNDGGPGVPANAQWQAVEAALAVGAHGQALGLSRPLVAEVYALEPWYAEAVRARAALLVKTRRFATARQFLAAHENLPGIAKVKVSLAMAQFRLGQLDPANFRARVEPLLGQLSAAEAAGLRIQILMAEEDLGEATSAVAAALGKHGMTAALAEAMTLVHSRLRDAAALRKALAEAAIAEADKTRLLEMAEAPVDYAGLLGVARALGERDERRRWAALLRAEQQRLVGDAAGLAASIPERLRSDPIVVPALFGVAVAQGDANKAEALLQVATWLEPSDRELWRLEVQRLRGRDEAMLGDLEAAVRKWPLHAGLRLALARAQVAADDSETAERHLEFVLALRPDDPAAALRLAAILMERNGELRAEGILRSALTMQPGNRALAQAFLGLAARMKDPGVQLVMRLRYASLAPGDGDNLIKIVALLEEMGHPEMGAMIVGRLSKQTRGLSLGQIRVVADGLRNRGEYAAGDRLLVDYAEAAGEGGLAAEAWLWVARFRHRVLPESMVATAFQRGLKADAGHAGIRVAYGHWLAAQGRLDEALKTLLTVAPEKRGTALVEAYLQAGEAAAARQALAAMTGLPALTKALLQMRVQLALGDFDAAWDAAKAAVAADPESVAARQAVVRVAFARPSPERLDGLEETLDRWVLLTKSEAEKVSAFRALAHYYQLTGQLKKAANTLAMVGRREGDEASELAAARLYLRADDAWSAASLVRPRMQAGAPSPEWLGVYARIVESDGKDATDEWLKLWRQTGDGRDFAEALTAAEKHRGKEGAAKILGEVPDAVRAEPAVAFWLLERPDAIDEVAWLSSAKTFWGGLSGDDAYWRCRILELVLWRDVEATRLAAALDEWEMDATGLLRLAQAVATARMGKEKEGIAAFESAVGKGWALPSAASGLLTYCCEALGRYELGIRTLESALENEPMALDLRANLAFLLARSERVEEAVELLAGAQRLVRGDKKMLAVLLDAEAACWLEAGAPFRAKQLVDRGLELYQLPGLYLRLSKILEQVDGEDNRLAAKAARIQARALALERRDWLVLRKLADE